MTGAEGAGGELRTLRISHPAFSGSLREETIAFYRDLLNMEVVLEQDNLDFPSEDHFFFHVGSDNFIAYFLPKPGADLSLYEAARPGSGWMDHLALDVPADSLDAWAARLRDAGVEFEGPADRGYERSLYFKDPNGVTIELLAWLTEPPPGVGLAKVIREGQARRIARGAALLEDADVRETLAHMGHGPD
jgi:glyoxylase I family protein